LTRYTTPHSTPLTLLATLASVLMNILPSRTKFRPSPFSKACYYHNYIRQLRCTIRTLIPSQLAPLPHPSFTPNSITVILSTTTYLSLRSPASNRFRTLLPVALAVVKSPKSCHIAPVVCSLHWLQITKRIEYKLLSLTYRVLTTTQPPYLHHLISVQPPRSTRSSSLVTRWTTNIIRVTYNGSLLSVCLTLSLESTSFSPSTSFQPLCLCPACSCSYTTSSHSVNSPLSPLITPSLFHSRLKTYLFHKSVQP